MNTVELNLKISDLLRGRSHRIIPGGCHTYAKGDDQYPRMSPAFIDYGKGSHVWDVDGNEYIEYGMGCRAVTLGHAYQPVIEAACRELLRGVNFSRPSRIEVECAEEFLSIVDADMVKFCKNGSDATTAAVRLARAFTGRDKVAICSDHPFYSIDDWAISKTPVNAGVPNVTKGLTKSFRYNDMASVEELFETYPGEIAAVILEAAKYQDPENNFLHRLRDLCSVNGCVFILDEMITGFRWHNGGAQRYYSVRPDLSTFGKALANGFSVAALAGRRDIMELGGLYHNKPRVFLLSTTHGAETHSLAAAIATIQTYKNEPVIETLFQRGKMLKSGLEKVIKSHDLEPYVEIVGKPCCLVFATRDQSGKPSQEFRSLLLQELARRGVIGPTLVLSYAHTEQDIQSTIAAYDGALAVYKKALSLGVAEFLIGPASKVVYRKFNTNGR